MLSTSVYPVVGSHGSDSNRAGDHISYPVIKWIEIYIRWRLLILGVPYWYAGTPYTAQLVERLVNYQVDVIDFCLLQFVELPVKEVRYKENVCGTIVLRSVANTKIEQKRANTRYL